MGYLPNVEGYIQNSLGIIYSPLTQQFTNLMTHLVTVNGDGNQTPFKLSPGICTRVAALFCSTNRRRIGKASTKVSWLCASNRRLRDFGLQNGPKNGPEGPNLLAVRHP